MTLSRKARAGRPILTSRDLDGPQLVAELRPAVQRDRRLALATLTKDWRPLQELRRSAEIVTDPWLALCHAGLAERLNDGGSISYRLKP